MTVLSNFIQASQIMYRLSLSSTLFIKLWMDQLNYHNNKKNNELKSASVSKRGPPRSLSDMNELFLTLTRLRLDLLEEIPQTTVSEIFIT